MCPSEVTSYEIEKIIGFHFDLILAVDATVEHHGLALKKQKFKKNECPTANWTEATFFFELLFALRSFSSPLNLACYRWSKKELRNYV